MWFNSKLHRKKGSVIMPGRDQTGPNGAGAMTGRRMGTCSTVNATGAGVGIGRGMRRGRQGCVGRGAERGMGLGRQAVAMSSDQQKVQLTSDIEILREELAAAETRLENLDNN
jgi:hypothetical protein